MNSFGRRFRVGIYGESHGPEIGILIDGVPPGIGIKEEDFKKDLLRRMSQKTGTTTRKETDNPIIKSGILKGKSTGASMVIAFENKDVRSGDYEKISHLPRPGHADFVAYKKFKGFNDYRGGGPFSGRLTVGMVAAGVVAKKILKNITLAARVISVGGEHGAQRIKETIESALRNGETLGGLVECRVKGLPIGLGEPFFDSVESLIGHLVFAIPGVKGIEFGSGFKGAKMKGSEHNDEILNLEGLTRTNHSGGINGGITNGNELIFRVAFKPTPSLGKPQKTINLSTGVTENIIIKGRHDTAFVLRTPVIVEAAAAITLADLMLLCKS